MDESLPPLAWVASLPGDGGPPQVRHGSRVEAGDGFVCEAVWAGSFERGGFDRTPLVFGSGVRAREGGVRFVPAGTTVDRLWVWRSDDGAARHLSNSLVELLSTVGTRPLDSHHRYERDLASVAGGLDACLREIPVAEGRLEVVYFDNLVWDGDELTRVEKPEIGRSFASFGEYRGFLSDAAGALEKNAASDARDHPVRLLTSITDGYDSPAASVLAREMGCRRAVTLRQARSLIPQDDSGREIGEKLGLEVEAYDRDPAIGRPELRYWAALGHPQDVNLGIFDYPGPVCLFVTGVHGDVFWTTDEHDTGDRIVRGETTGLGFTEDRLCRGVLHCRVPFWGVRKASQVYDITRSREMAPWRLGNDYDRPVPRRIVEEAGIPRQAFGQRKGATSFEWRLFPFTPALREDFIDYVEARGAKVTPLPLRRAQAVLQRYLGSLEYRWSALEGRLPTVGPDIPAVHFQWALDRLTGA